MFNRVHGEFASFWLAAGDSSGLPRKADIDPSSFPPRILPHLALWDVITHFPNAAASAEKADDDAGVGNSDAEEFGSSDGSLPDIPVIRVRLRLAGGVLRDFAQRNLAGLYLDEFLLDSDVLQHKIGVFRTVRDSRCAVGSSVSVSLDTIGITTTLTRLFCPLIGKDGEVSMVLSAHTVNSTHAISSMPSYFNFDRFEDHGNIVFSHEELQRLIPTWMER